MSAKSYAKIQKSRVPNKKNNKKILILPFFS